MAVTFLLYQPMATLKGEGRLCMDESAAPTEPRVIASGVTLDPNSITNEELAEWLKLAESEIPKVTGPRETSDLPSSSRVLTLVVATIAGSITLAWIAFLVWLFLKALSLL
jgi:hypothetical protein